MELRSTIRNMTSSKIIERELEWQERKLEQKQKQRLQDEMDAEEYDDDDDDDDDEQIVPEVPVGEFFTMEDIETHIDFTVLLNQPTQDLKMHITKVLYQKWEAALQEYSKLCKDDIDAKGDDLVVNQRDVAVNAMSKIADVKKKASDSSRGSGGGSISKSISTSISGKSGKSSSSKSCANMQQTVNALTRAMAELKKSGTEDDLLSGLDGTAIVYGKEWTSDTYQPDPLQASRNANANASSNPSSIIKLGDPKIRQYIPEDWERLLPKGWQEWNLSKLQDIMTSPTPQNIIPASFWHSLPPAIVEMMESPFTNNKAIPASTEIIMMPNSQLGSCWCMAGRSGRVTIRLAQAVVVESITVEHYPWVPSAHNAKELERHVMSAPRHMSIIGYPACGSGDVDDDVGKECKSQLGFDADTVYNFGAFEYLVDTLGFVDENDMDLDNIPTSSSQTFAIVQNPTVGDGDDDDDDFGGFAGDDDNDDDNDDDDDDAIGGGGGESGCSAIKPTCEGAPKEEVAVQAITIKVDENWGYPDSTCIYRIKVNGEVVA